MKTSALALFMALFGAVPALQAAPAPLADLRLPPGFEIEVFADDVPGARTLRRGDQGTLFVSTRQKSGRVYALRDTDGDGRPDKTYVLADGLNMPNGIAFVDGALYVAEVHRLLRFDAIESRLDKPQFTVVRSDFPTETHHGWRYLALGPDRKLYMAVGAPCNVCEGEDFKAGKDRLQFATLTRMNLDGSNWEVIAKGVRNSVGFDFEPGTNKLWFTDNGRDWLGDDSPDCELNRLDTVGQHFGFPYCHAGDVRDPEFSPPQPCAAYNAPQAKLGPHTAPLGLRFYTGSQFPAEYHGDIFVARRGSWNRSEKIGYDVMRVKVREGRATSVEPFVTGWLQGQKVSGRPVDVLVMPDGSLLISDDTGGRIYRVRYTLGAKSLD